MWILLHTELYLYGHSSLNKLGNHKILVATIEYQKYQAILNLDFASNPPPLGLFFLCFILYGRVSCTNIFIFLVACFNYFSECLVVDEFLFHA